MAQPAHETYTKALLKKFHGHALWEPDPGTDAPVELADVGYVQNGAFIKLFNASKGPNHPSNPLGLPDGHEPCPIGPIQERNALQGGLPISSEGVSEVGAAGSLGLSAGGYWKFDGSLRLSRSQGMGASLILGDNASREDVLDKRRLAEYFRRHYDSFRAFAVAQGREMPPSGLRFVTGCDKTTDWACAAWSSSTTNAELTFSASAFGFDVVGFSVWGRWESNESLDTNVGPPSASQSIATFLLSVLWLVMAFIYNIIWLPPSQDPSRLPNSSYNPRSNQCVFFRSYCMGDKLSFLRPRLLVETDQGVTVVTRDVTSFTRGRESRITSSTPSKQAGSLGSDSSTKAGAPGTSIQTTYDDKALHEPRDVEFSDLDLALADISEVYDNQTPTEALMGFIFEKSNAEKALVHDNDLIDLLQHSPDQAVYDFKNWIRNLTPQPRIYVDEGVGMFEPTYFELQSLLMDITDHVQTDSPRHSSIGYGANWDLFSGTYSIMDSNTGKTGVTQVVVKVLVGTANETEKIEQRLRLEVTRWGNFKHPNVAELQGVARLYPGRPLGLVYRSVRNQNLLQYIGKNPGQKLDKAKEIAAGLEYLHEQRVIVGDLRADNVNITDEGQAQISDYGIAQILDASSFMKMTQSNIRFTAPELMPADLDVDPLDVHPTFQSDIFSLGMLLLQLFHGSDGKSLKGLPYNHIRVSSEIGMVKRIHDGVRPRRKRYNHIDDKHWNLLCLCWAGDPSKRPAIGDVRQAL